MMGLSELAYIMVKQKTVYTYHYRPSIQREMKLTQNLKTASRVLCCCWFINTLHVVSSDHPDPFNSYN